MTAPRFHLCLVLAAAAVSPCRGVILSEAPRGLLTREWTVQEGMPENFALQLARSAHGFLWAATRQGLVRMNGERVEQVRVEGEKIPPFPFVTAIRFDAQNRIWVGTRQGIAVMKDGVAVPGTWSAGWPLGDPPSGWEESARGVVAVTEKGHWLEFDGNHWNPLPSPAADGSGHGGLAREPDGTVWGTQSGVLARLDNGLWIPCPAPGDGRAVLGLASAAAGGVWAVTDNALYLRKDGKWLSPLPVPGVGLDFKGMREDPQGGVWIFSASHGLWRVAPETGAVEHHQEGLPKVIDSIFPTARDAVWLGTRGEGVVQAWRAPFTILETKPAPVYEIRTLPDGRLLIPTLSEGILVGKPGGEFERWPGSDEERNAFTAVPARDGSVWSGGQNGINSYSPAGVRRLVRGGDGRCALIQAPDGPMILADRLGIEEFTDDQPGVRVELPKEASGRGIYFLTVLHGKVYAGGEWGLVLCREGGKWIVPPGLEGLHSHVTGIVAQEGSQDLWMVAQEDGLVHYSGGKARIVPFAGLRERNIEVVAPVIAAGRIWLGCPRHVVSVKLEEAKAAAAVGRPAEVRVVGGARVSGMPTMRMSFPACAAVLPDGAPCFATNEGIMRMDIADEPLPSPPPISARFRTLTLGAESRNLTRAMTEVTLPRGTTALPVHLETTNLQTADPVAFRFQIDEGEWARAPHGGFIVGNLEPGSHTLRAQASRLGHAWSGNSTSLTLTIPLFWWQDPWTVASLIALFGVSVPSLVAWGVKIRLHRQRRRLQEAASLIESRELALNRVSRFRKLIDASQDIIVVFDPETGVITDANAAAAAALAAPGAELQGVRIQSLSPDWPSAAVAERDGDLANFETIFRRHDGKKFPAEVSVRLARDDSGLSFGLAIARDISGRQSAQARERSLENQVLETRKLEAVSELAGGVAHDFNNLLRIIQDFTHTSGESPGPLRREVEEAAGRAGQITRQLLAFSRSTPVEREEIRLAERVPRSLKNIRRILGAGVEVEFTVAARLPAILADPAQIEQVLLNLALNAGDAMPAGGNLHIRAETRVWEPEDIHMPGWARPGEWVRLTVRDTGAGMEEATKKRIFDPFFTTKTDGQSNGLGLSVVYGIAQSHGGFLRVTSALGRGTSVEIYFPALPPGGDGEEDDGTEPLPATILLAEDDPTERQLAAMILRGAGHEVIIAADGLEAVAAFERDAETIDLVILDALMPGLTGFAAAGKIRESAPHMPILFCSGYSDLEDFAEDTLPPGASVLYKPYSMEKLLRVVAEHLGKTSVSR